MHYSILRLPHGLISWDLVESYYELRASVFVRQLGWPLDLIDDRLEAEIYDAAPLAHYVLAHDGGSVVAGARLLKCDVEYSDGVKDASYMIRDAFLGRNDFPRNLWSPGEPPFDSRTWELSRMVSATADRTVMRSVMLAANAYIKQHGAERVLFLTDPKLLWLGRRIGFDPVPRGPVIKTDHGRYLAYECDVI